MPSYFSNHFTLNPDIHFYNTPSRNNIHIGKVFFNLGLSSFSFAAAKLFKDLEYSVKYRLSHFWRLLGCYMHGWDCKHKLGFVYNISFSFLN